MTNVFEDALDRGRKFGAALALAMLCGCAASARPLVLPAGHPADPATAGTTPPAGEAPPIPAAPEPSAPSSPESATWTCPMHAEVVSSSPGRCPKCGMQLRRSPAVPAAGER